EVELGMALFAEAIGCYGIGDREIQRVRRSLGSRRTGLHTPLLERQSELLRAQDQQHCRFERWRLESARQGLVVCALEAGEEPLSSQADSSRGARWRGDH